MGAKSSKESKVVEMTEDIFAEFVNVSSFLLKLNVAMVNNIATVIESKKG